MPRNSRKLEREAIISFYKFLDSIDNWFAIPIWFGCLYLTSFTTLWLMIPVTFLLAVYLLFAVEPARRWVLAMTKSGARDKIFDLHFEWRTTPGLRARYRDDVMAYMQDHLDDSELDAFKKRAPSFGFVLESSMPSLLLVGASGYSRTSSVHGRSSARGQSPASGRSSVSDRLTATRGTGWGGAFSDEGNSVYEGRSSDYSETSSALQVTLAPSASLQATRQAATTPRATRQAALAMAVISAESVQTSKRKLDSDSQAVSSAKKPRRWVKNVGWTRD
jgi:hypothetical protein